jgi:hypothetical protein
MKINNLGEIVFNDRPEMFYHMFDEIGLDINREGYLYDIDNRNIIKFKDKNIKTTQYPGVPVYCGNNDIVFEPLTNYNLMISLFGYYIDTQCPPDFFIAQYIEDDETNTLQRVVIKTINGDIYSPFYNNIYLGYCYCIFALSDQNVNLDNFDIVLGE